MLEKNNYNANPNIVGSLDVKRVEKDKKENKDTTSNVYEKFCNKYLENDFKSIKSNKLKKIYNDGIELLNNYYITNVKIKDNKFIFQIQFITIKIYEVIQDRKNQEIIKRNNELNNNLQSMIKTAEELKTNYEKEQKEIKKLKGDIKSLIATILAIVLAFSIIPTSITAIQRIDTNYILPFMGTIVIFGMIITFFIYSIYQDKIKPIDWFILIFTIIVCILLWINALKGFININNPYYKEIENKIELEEN